MDGSAREKDPVDAGCAENEAFQEAAVASGLQAARAELAPADEWRTASATHCEDCGDPIPNARRQAIPGCRLCASCKGFSEMMNKKRGY